MEHKPNNPANNIPLAERLRPRNLDEVAGQEHVLGKDKPLRLLIEAGDISSIIFWGPPGCGKTTLARLIATYTKSRFIEFSAVTSGIAEVRKVVEEADKLLHFNGEKTILFIDEIHRFNKAQQDAFLPHVEKGTIILIGATTENPGFSVNAPLISRSRIFKLEELSDDDIKIILKRAIKEFKGFKFAPKALDHIIKTSNGDARTALNALEMATKLSQNIDLQIAEKAVQKKAIYYDKKGDWHYDTISAFIKSMRGSDPNATLYWLARMLKAGEDPVFIARRMVIFASEDINVANNTALILAESCMNAVKMIGLPEAQIILAHVAVVLAQSPKTIATYAAYSEAAADIDLERIGPVPLHMRNASNKVMKQMNYGKGHIRYKWQDPEGHKNQSYLPDELKNRKYYRPEEFK